MTLQTCHCPNGSKEIKDKEKNLPNQFNTATDSYHKTKSSKSSHKAGEDDVKSMLGEQQSPSGKAMDWDEYSSLWQYEVIILQDYLGSFVTQIILFKVN